MQDNWYEAAVAAEAPHRIISVVDWASDSPVPFAPVPKEPQGATYNVFAWGINDPSVGERSIQKEAARTSTRLRPLSVGTLFPMRTILSRSTSG